MCLLLRSKINSMLKIPEAPNSIQKGVPLKLTLGEQAINQLGSNLQFVHAQFDKEGFVADALNEIDELGITQRSAHIADSMRRFLPQVYSVALSILIKSLTPALDKTEGNGLASMFYMPHCSYISKFGVDPAYNEGQDPFEISIQAQYELTKRFTCEFSIRAFIVADEKRTLDILYKWMLDEDPHVRRLCSEGTRSRLPWATKIDSFIKDPSPVIPILEALKNDPDLYVRRSVANHVGDIAKDHLDVALNLCELWLIGATPELKWVIRHALRNPFKKGIGRAIEIRKAAK
ncbi:MAG: 3-methyladenine DNA glycosylase AlkC [Parvicellaceae bacterium]|jgi:3-methyladenine DNA glycosylase AlkC